jgi:hypothetical protein
VLLSARRWLPRGSRARLATDFAGGVLAAYRIGPRIFGTRADRADHLGLLAAHRIGAERRRRLHGHHRQQLEQVVGHHVAQGAGVSKKLPRVSTPTVSAAVICTWSM